MFTVFKSDNGLQPWEYFPAAAGEYHAGQMLNLSGGKLTALAAASTTTPGYICQAEKTVAEGEVLPVVRVTRNKIYKTTLSAAAADAKAGSKLQVSKGGLQVDAAAEGTFEVTYIEDIAVDSTVCGRFL